MYMHIELLLAWQARDIESALHATNGFVADWLAKSFNKKPVDPGYSPISTMFAFSWFLRMRTKLCNAKKNGCHPSAGINRPFRTCNTSDGRAELKRCNSDRGYQSYCAAECMEFITTYSSHLVVPDLHRQYSS
jgi:hypothetical protein